LVGEANASSRQDWLAFSRQFGRASALMIAEGAEMGVSGKAEYN
jgi:hypothetical protein